MSSGPTVDTVSRSTVDVDTSRWAQVAVETLLAENVDRGQLDLSFVDEDEMADLNRVHMAGDGPTDVLSFPLDGEVLGPADGRPHDIVDDGGAVPVLLGDVVICPPVAARQAPEHCGDLDAELTLLVIHGVLHVLGYDHAEPDEAAAMIGRETAHLDRYGIAHPGPQEPSNPTL